MSELRFQRMCRQRVFFFFWPAKRIMFLELLWKSTPSIKVNFFLLDSYQFITDTLLGDRVRLCCTPQSLISESSRDPLKYPAFQISPMTATVLRSLATGACSASGNLTEIGPVLAIYPPSARQAWMASRSYRAGSVHKLMSLLYSGPMPLPTALARFRSGRLKCMKFQNKEKIFLLVPVLFPLVSLICLGAFWRQLLV